MKNKILELRAAGWTYQQIAAEVGLSKSRVGEIVRKYQTRKLIEQIRAQKEASPPIASALAESLPEDSNRFQA